jgi:hypothetical protein
MRVLLVEPDYRRGKPNIENRTNDETLWYPPLSLLKLARFHKDRGDEVKFVSGFNPSLFQSKDLFAGNIHWDRVYITTLFTFHFDKIVQTINAYREAVGGTVSNIFVGGIMASLMPNEIFEETGIYPFTGILNSPDQIRLTNYKNKDNVNIDLLPPYYEILKDIPYYAINETFYGYTSRGCTNKCSWCGVPKIEPEYLAYIDIKNMVRQMREEYGDKPKLKLMDNNILASDKLEQIINDLLELGYGRGEKTIDGKQRIVDFNQGLDATHLTEKKMKLLSKINIRPMRIAFDRLSEKDDYVRAVKLASNAGVVEFSNYMLYNWKDTPKDLYDRIMTNIKLNEFWRKNEIHSQLYSYPMRYAPIAPINGDKEHHKRDFIKPLPVEEYDLINKAVWTKRFMRNLSVIEGAAHGAIPTTPSLAKRAVGETYEEFLMNLYMPETLLRYRNKYEKKIYPDEPKRKPGDGTIEEFRKFIWPLLKNPTKEFLEFHKVICQYNMDVIKKYNLECTNKIFKKWLKWYCKK